MNTFIKNYIPPLQDDLLRGAPSHIPAIENSFQRFVNCVGYYAEYLAKRARKSVGSLDYNYKTLPNTVEYCTLWNASMEWNRKK